MHQSHRLRFGCGSCRYTVNGMHEPNVILKDNDLKFKIRLPLDVALTVVRQLRKDSEFLASMGIMDYSLLLGVHNTEYDVQPIRIGGGDDEIKTPGVKKTPISTIPFAQSDNEEAKSSPARSIAFTEPQQEEPREEDEASIASSTSGRPETSMKRRRTLTHTQLRAASTNSVSTNDAKNLSLTKMLEVYRVVGPDTYFLGIIDFQQKWNWSKQMERFFKINFQGADPDGLSAVEPEQYKERCVRCPFYSLCVVILFVISLFVSGGI